MTTRPVTSGSSRFVSAKWPRWFVPNCSSKPSAVRERGGTMTPALLTSRSSGPLQPSANSRTDARLARSSRRTSVVPGIAAAAVSPFAVSRTARTTRAPAPANARAAARPMPLLAPVTITLRPVMSGRFWTPKVVMDNNVGSDSNAVNDNIFRYAHRRDGAPVPPRQPAVCSPRAGRTHGARARRAGALAARARARRGRQPRRAAPSLPRPSGAARRARGGRVRPDGHRAARRRRRRG